VGEAGLLEGVVLVAFFHDLEILLTGLLGNQTL
jgi:hypothetical protein